jgi:hypothetical protein
MHTVSQLDYTLQSHFSLEKCARTYETPCMWKMWAVRYVTAEAVILLLSGRDLAIDRRGRRIVASCKDKKQNTKKLVK